MSEPDDLPLASEFPSATRADWLKLVDAVLKGRPFDKTLVGTTYDALRIEPLYPPAKAARPVAARTPGQAWSVMQRVDHPDPVAANAEALHDLENGANGLVLSFAGSVGAYGYGLDPSEAALGRALAGVHVEAGIAIDLDLGWHGGGVPFHLAELIKRRGLDAAKVDLRTNLDPLGAIAFNGASVAAWPVLAPRFAATVQELAAQGFAGPLAAADGRVVHNAGGSEAQELAFVLAVALAYLRAFEAAAVPLDQARRWIEFRLTADADQFLTVAKFRALRMLWARIEQACGLAPKPALVAAETAWRMMTRHDPWVNMLRATIATFAAGIGGADAITVLPFTAARGLPDRFARRIARNTQLILQEESHLAAVADPAAGSGAIEDLTRQLCGAAWSLFRDIEKQGGVWPALEQGVIRRQVGAVRNEREQTIAHRREALTGTSEFPDLNETPVSVIDARPVPVPPPSAALSLAPLRSIRLAEPYEQLRDASDRMLAATGARPKVFLANLGRPADFNERASFAKNFFEAGGIEAVTNDGFATHDALVAGFRASGAKLACLCSSDEVYAREAAAAVKALEDAGAKHFYQAGKPNAETHGAPTSVYVGCDALATLQQVHDMLRATS